MNSYSERTRRFRVKYEDTIEYITAHTKYQAIDKMYTQLICSNDSIKPINRSQITIVK